MIQHLESLTDYALAEPGGLTRESWDALVAGSPGGGHALQSFTWGEFKKEQRWKPLRLVLERDGEAAGTAQFLLYNTLPVPGYLMYCPKGPWIPWEDEAAVRAFFAEVGNLARNLGVHTVKVEPEIACEQTQVRETLESLGLVKGRYDLNFADTMALDLSRSEDELFAGMKGKKGKSTRYNIRLAERKGVEVRQPEDFEWAFDRLYGWMRDLAVRKEGYRITRSREYFRQAMRAMYEADQGRFFVAFHEERPVAAAFFFTLGYKLWYMYSASPAHDRSLNPNYLLQWEAMRWARERGITYYDMMSIPPEESRREGAPGYGVYRFKKGFGGQAMRFVGCLDLPVMSSRAAAWRRLEPFYYRAYARLKNNIFY